MSRKNFTDEQEKFILDNYLQMTNMELAEALNCNYQKLKRYMSNHKLSRRKLRYITAEEEKYMIDNFETKSYQEIADDLKMRKHQVISHLNYLGYCKIGKYECSYFHVIDNPTKAYWLGFLYADGTIGYVPQKRWYSVAIGLQARDKYILEELNSHFENGGTFNETITNDPIMGYQRETTSHIWYLRLNRKEIAEDLMSHNILPNKTHKKEYPTVEECYFFDLLRGFLDGDGCIHLQKDNNYPTVSLANNNELFLAYIKDKLFSDYNINSSLQFRKNKNVKYLELSGIYAMRLLQYLYQDVNCIKLKRKYDKYLLAKEWLISYENRKLKRAKSVNADSDINANTEVS